jgi:cell division protein YceG involved in septum cleavage
VVALLILALGVLAVVLASRSATPRPRPSSLPRFVNVVIPEGKTRIQIAQIAAAAGLTGSYRASSTRSPLLDPVRYGAPRGTPDLEGFLFPATYEMYAGAPAGRLASEQLAAFQERFGASELRRARELHITPYQLLIVASMVEREAQTVRDRPLIAAVIYNRLRRGTPLGIDATLYYAIELEKGVPTYTRELDSAQLRIDSPYNTRTRAGLPPTPISNPGLASIEAAAHPAHVPYLYYVLAADGCGEHVFSRTLAEFERNAAAYRAALARNGGHLPACKGK